MSPDPLAAAEPVPRPSGDPTTVITAVRPVPANPNADAVAAIYATSDRGSRIAAVIIAFGWHLAISLPAIVLSWSEFRSPEIVAAGWVIFAVIGVIATPSLVRGARLPVWPLVAALLLVDAAVFACTPAPLLFDRANWGWATLGWFVVLVLWDRRISELIAVLAAGAVIALVGVLAAGAGNAAGLSRYVMCVYGISVLPIALVLGAGALRTLAGGTAVTAAARAAIDAEREAAARAQRERRKQLSRVGRNAGVILAELADGRADPADPAVQRRCALEAARLRRLIAESDDVPDPLLHELRACVDIAERNGLPVEFVAVGTLPSLPVEIRRRLAEPLTATLAAARDWARLTVVGGPGEVVVSLTTPSGGTETGGPEQFYGDDSAVAYFYERDEDLIWTQTRWAAT